MNIPKLIRDLRKQIAELEKEIIKYIGITNGMSAGILLGQKLAKNKDKRIAELEKLGLELVASLESHHESAFCDVFDYDELEAANEILKGQGE